MHTTIREAFWDKVAAAVLKDRAGDQLMGGRLILQCETPEEQGAVSIDTDLSLEMLTYIASGQVDNFGVEMKTSKGVTTGIVTAHVDWYWEELS